MKKDVRPSKVGARRRMVGLCAVAVLLPVVLSSCNWLVYHGGMGGSGSDPSGASYASAHQAWVSASLGGQLYGEPLALGSQVFVATTYTSPLV